MNKIIHSYIDLYVWNAPELYISCISVVDKYQDAFSYYASLNNMLFL